MSILSYFDRKVKEKDRTYMTLSDKHAPCTIDNFLGNDKQIKEIHKWFVSKQPSLIVHGLCGSGKTHLINLFVRYYKINVFVNCSNSKRSKKELTQFHDKIRFNMDSVLIIDEVETLITKHENMSIAEISKWISKKYIRVIFISNSVVMNKLAIIKENQLCKTIELEYPDTGTLFNKCLDILKKENVDINDSDTNCIKQYIVNMNNEPRSIFDSLLISNFTYNFKDRDMDIYQAYQQIIDPSVPLNTKIKIFGVDSGTIPVLFQENYIDVEMGIEDRCKISNNMSDADVFHKKIFIHTSNLYVEMYAVMSSIFDEIIKSPRNNLGKRPRFGLIWTKQSAMCQKRKYLHLVQQSMKSPFYNSMDLYYMHGYLKTIVEEYKINPLDKRGILNFISKYNIQNIDILFYIYISFNIGENSKKNEIKPLTKKAFFTYFQILFNK